MSFLLDPPLLVASGAAIERLTGDEDTADRLSRVTLAGFLGISVTLWNDVDAPLLRPLWRPFGSAGPRDFMVNSGVLRLPVPRRPTPRDHLAAAVVFATYPLFLSLGRRLGRRRRSRAGSSPGARHEPRAGPFDAPTSVASREEPEQAAEDR